MFRRLLDLIKQALRKMVAYKDISETVENVNVYTVSDAMTDSLDTWKSVYKDKSKWLSDEEGVYSLGLGKQICEAMQIQVLAEMESSVSTPGDIENDDDPEMNTNTRARYLNNIYNKHLIDKLPNNLEKGMALGGVVIKPYVDKNTIYFDFTYQGDFYPITFDDNGNMTDVAFIDQFISGGRIFTKVERQTFAEDKMVIENKAFVAEIVNADDGQKQDLGMEVTLDSIVRWSSIEPQVTIENIDRPLFGYYRVPIANNVDMNSPMGISIFSPALHMIQRADEQFSRLDWEYNGGQMAIDVDPSAINYTTNYFKTGPVMDTFKKRLYRGIDVGTDQTYNAFAPSLRDTSYLQGLNKYLARIEDLVGIARGTISDVTLDVRTATEIKILRQRTYITVSANQKSLDKALKDAVYAADILCSIYGMAPEGEYTVNIDWKDNILTDTETELTQKISLVQADILSKAEVRAWYTDEDIETAQKMIDQIAKDSTNGLMNDIYNSGNKDQTLE